MLKRPQKHNHKRNPKAKQNKTPKQFKQCNKQSCDTSVSWIALVWTVLDPFTFMDIINTQNCFHMWTSQKFYDDKCNKIKRTHSILLIVAKQLYICRSLHFRSVWVAEQSKSPKQKEQPIQYLCFAESAPWLLDRTCFASHCTQENLLTDTGTRTELITVSCLCQLKTSLPEISNPRKMIFFFIKRAN